MLVNPIRLPSWLNNKTVFQQKVPFVIRGTAAPSATITLEISKDPTDGRRVSKLDAEYGVILSLETTTSSKGEFVFNIPAYTASTDTYTFIFKCFMNTVTFSDIRCGDVWVFLGSDYLSIPIRKANAPSTPMKRQIMSHLRFFTPSRDGLETDESDIDYEVKTHFKDAHWIKVTDTSELADVSTSAFAFAYSMADQVNYPIGVIDLSVEDSTIINWISDKAMEAQEALYDYLDGLRLVTDEERYRSLIKRDRDLRKTDTLRQEIKRDKSFFDFDLGKEAELRALEGGGGITEGDSTATAVSAAAGMADLDFPTSAGSSMNRPIKPRESEQGATRNLDFNLFADIRIKTEKAASDSGYIRKKYRPSIMYKAKLRPLVGMPIRGMCFSPNTMEKSFERYDLLLMGLLGTLSDVFEPREVYDDSVMPSFLMVSMHPKCVDYENPYSVIEFNENLQAFAARLNMPSGIISLHDMLLPDKTKSFTLGRRLAIVALGIHFTPKMPKSCPTCSGVEKAGNKLILQFNNLGDGLRLNEGETELRGFAVCGDDRIFHPAEARILHGVRVMVWNDKVADPVSVTYGFYPFPHEATFRNLNDLPVLPFRFDRDSAYYAPELFFTNCDRLEFVGMRTPEGEFEKLDVYQTFKGNGVITVDTMNKTEGHGSLHIRYDTENSLYGFEPVLSYASLMAPLEIRGRSRLLVDVFNPDTIRKTMRIEGFGEAEIRQQLNWQTLTFACPNADVISLDSMRITIEDTSRQGEIYIDNIRFE